MPWLDKLFLLLALAWPFLLFPSADGSMAGALFLLAGLLAWVTAAVVSAAWPARRTGPVDGWFVRFGHLAWAVAFPLAISVALVLRPLYRDAASSGGTDTQYAFVTSAEIATAAMMLFLVTSSVVHGSLFRWSDRWRRTDDGAVVVRRHPRGVRRVVRTVAITVAGLGLYLLPLGLLVTVVDPSSSDYWLFASVAAPALLLLGVGLWALAGHETSGKRVVIVDDAP